MPLEFYLTQPAIRDIEAIADYIADEAGLQQAEWFLEKLNAKFAKITQFPNIGRPDTKFCRNYAAFPWRATSFSMLPQKTELISYESSVDIVI